MHSGERTTHRDRIVDLLERNGMARLSEILETGATAAAVARLTGLSAHDRQGLRAG